MLTSLALIFLVGLAMAALCQQLHLPRIIGMLVTGILLGPCVLNALDASILSISSELRQMALIIILIKAGLSLNLADLKKVGRPAVMMSCVPASCEILAFILFAPAILGITRIEAAVMGAVLGAVSPAVVIPRMVQLMDEHYGTEKSIPQLIMAGASCDDIFVIVLFSTFTSMAQGGSANIMDFVNIPVSILLGIALGAAVGFVLSWFFETAYARAHTVRNSMKVIIVLGMAFLLMSIESWLKGIVSVSGLLAVVSMACVLKMRCVPSVSKRLSEKFSKLWLAAEVILFVLVGAAVDIRYTLAAGIPDSGEDAWLRNRQCFLGGARLGLLLCRECCRRMGWGLRVEKAPECGTQAVVTIPLSSGRSVGQTVELHADSGFTQMQKRYQLRTMLVKELRTMPERGDPDDL